LSALAEGQPAFSSGTGRFTIGITGQDDMAYHVHPLRGVKPTPATGLPLGIRPGAASHCDHLRRNV
jgi:hypothetical protein